MAETIYCKQSIVKAKLGCVLLLQMSWFETEVLSTKLSLCIKISGNNRGYRDGSLFPWSGKWQEPKIPGQWFSSSRKHQKQDMRLWKVPEFLGVFLGAWASTTLKKIRIFTGKVVESSEIYLCFGWIIQTQNQEYVYI